MRPAHFVQLTDLHIRAGGALAYGRVDTLAFLRRAVDHINALQPVPDAVLVSGDLVDFGDADEYAVLRPELDRLEMPYLPIPGNHDGPAFWEVFADRMTNPLPGVGYATTIAGVPLVFLDTTVSGASHGELTEERAAFLEETLRADALLIMHHPPTLTGIGHMDRIGLLGRERFAALILQNPPLGILCGHIHRTIFSRIGSVPVIVGPSVAHAVTFDLSPEAPSTFHMEPPGVLVHTVEGGTLLTHLSFIGDFEGPFPFSGAFEP